MLTVSRNVFLAAIAVSVLAGCKTTTPPECDNLKPKVTYNGKCCGIGDGTCKEGRNSPPQSHTPNPTPQ